MQQCAFSLRPTLLYSLRSASLLLCVYIFRLLTLQYLQYHLKRLHYSTITTSLSNIGTFHSIISLLPDTISCHPLRRSTCQSPPQCAIKSSNVTQCAGASTTSTLSIPVPPMDSAAIWFKRRQYSWATPVQATAVTDPRHSMEAYSQTLGTAVVHILRKDDDRTSWSHCITSLSSDLRQHNSADRTFWNHDIRLRAIDG